jgi:hypothetical protein
MFMFIYVCVLSFLTFTLLYISLSSYFNFAPFNNMCLYMYIAGDAVRIRAGVNPAKSCAACCCTGFSLVMQTIEPGPTPGFAFLAASGTILEKDLAQGEIIVVSTGCVVGFSKNVTLGVRSNGGCCVCCFSGEGLFSTTLEGPGKVMLQSMPIDKIRALFPQPNLKNGTDTSSAGNA